MRGRSRWIFGATAAMVAVAIAAFLLVSRASNPLEVVGAWTAARNAGDVDAAMAFVGDEGDFLGIAVQLPGERERLRANLEAQAVAGWEVEDTDCIVDDSDVTCRYRQTDDILARWGLALTGEHRYVVRDGKLDRIRRIHDRDSQREVYAAADAFREWVRANHPDAFAIIWVDLSTALYSTPEGAAAALALLDEYDSARAR